MKYEDINAAVGGLLRDLALAQSSPQKAFGYKRAADAVLSLDRALTDLVRSDQTLDRIQGVGPASTKIIFEVLATGSSPTVERAVLLSDRAPDIERQRRLRTNALSRAEVLRVLADPSFEGPTLAAYRGDLQMHSEWSDGSATLAEMADACANRGYQYAAMTDHSHGLKIASGMSMAESAKQHDAIDRLNERFGSRFRLLKGIEANIDAEGNLDLSEVEAAQFELVLAAPHAKLRSPDDQTARMLRAVDNPRVHVLAHPRGRKAGSREGVLADWDAVFARAAERGVAVELDGDPSRQDLDHTLAVRARDAGCLFAIDSDAHHPSQLRYSETAIAHARLAGIPPERIINCWDRERLLDWLATRRATSPHPRATSR